MKLRNSLFAAAFALSACSGLLAPPPPALVHSTPHLFAPTLPLLCPCFALALCSVFDMFEMLCFPPVCAEEHQYPQFCAFLLAVCCGTSKNCYPDRLAIDSVDHRAAEADGCQDMQIGAPADRILTPHRYART